MTKNLPFVDLATQYQRLKPRMAERIQAVLDHGQYILGPEIAELESELKAFCGAAHCVGVASGTDALQMAMMAHEIGPGDAVFVPTFTFTATAEVVLILGATPVFVDIEEDSFNLDPEHLAEQVNRVLDRGKLKPRAIVAVDLFGLPAGYKRLAKLAREHDLLLLDDAAQGFGATVNGRKVGALAPITATSFFPAKPLGAYGDGGAIFTEDGEVAEVLRSIRMHGSGGDRYDIVRVGVNGRLDTLQAAVLLVKLEVFEEELEARNDLAAYYSKRLAGRVRVPVIPDGVRSAWAQYTVRIADRDRVQASLREHGIPTAIYYPRPMHLQTAYVPFGDGPGSCPVAEKTSQEVLSLPMHPYLGSDDRERVCDLVLETVGAQS